MVERTKAGGRHPLVLRSMEDGEVRASVDPFGSEETWPVEAEARASQENDDQEYWAKILGWIFTPAIILGLLGAGVLAIVMMGRTLLTVAQTVMGD